LLKKSVLSCIGEDEGTKLLEMLKNRRLDCYEAYKAELMSYSVTNTCTPRLEQVTSGRATLAGMGGLVLGLVTSNTIPLKDPKIAVSVT
jgi:hypothetical protein